MITCPTCGHSVPDNQRFCGNCGTDVQAAMPAAPQGTPIGEGQPAPYAYAQSPGYGYESPLSSEPARPPSRMVIIAAVLLLAACCAFACGLLFGFELIPDLLGIGGAAGSTPVPKPTPTRESLLPIIYLLGFV